MDVEYTGVSAAKGSANMMENELETQSATRDPFNSHFGSQGDKIPFPSDSKAKLFKDNFWSEACFDYEQSGRKNRYYSDNNISIDNFKQLCAQTSENGLFPQGQYFYQKMDEESKEEKDRFRTHKKIPGLVNQIQDFLKTKPVKKFKKSGEKDSVFVHRFELDSNKEEKSGKKGLKMVQEETQISENEEPTLDPLQSKLK